jgi:hypothetical protein
MKIQRLLGGLAVACLFASVAPSAVSAQVRATTRPSYSRPAARSYSPAPAATALPIRFGIRAGMNVADWSGQAVQSALNLTDYTNGAISKEMRPGFHAGVYATIPLGSHFAIEPGVLYSEKGTVLRGELPFESLSFLGAGVKATARLGYVDVPVLAKVYFGEGTGFYLFGGPQVSFLVSAKTRVDAGLLGFSAYKQNFDIKSGLRPVDFGLSGGLGYQFESGLGLSAGYDYGLSSLDANNRFASHNEVIKASVNYSF